MVITLLLVVREEEEEQPPVASPGREEREQRAEITEVMAIPQLMVQEEEEEEREESVKTHLHLQEVTLAQEHLAQLLGLRYRTPEEVVAVQVIPREEVPAVEGAVEEEEVIMKLEIQLL